MFALILCVYYFNSGSRISGLSLHATVMKLEMHAEIKTSFAHKHQGGGGHCWLEVGKLFRFSTLLLSATMYGLSDYCNLMEITAKPFSN